MLTYRTLPTPVTSFMPPPQPVARPSRPPSSTVDTTPSFATILAAVQADMGPALDDLRVHVDKEA